MKLSTFMLEERFFKMQTPINPSREIALTPEFNDVEFDKFEISEHTISFFIKEDKVCELAHVKGKMVGTDTRGGETILEPTPSSRSRFDRFWKPERVRPLYIEPVEFSLNDTGLGIISDLKEAKKYNSIGIKRNPDTITEIDNLFQKGFDKVLYVQNPPINFDSFVSLMINMSDAFAENTKVGAVQGFSRKSSKDPAAVSVEEDEWDGFVLTKHTWSVIKGKALKAKTRNFKRTLKVIFEEKRLVRLSLDMSRNRTNTSNDARRKKFNV